MSKKWVILDVWGVIFEISNLVNDLLISFIYKKDNKISKEYILELYYKASSGEIKSSYFWKKLGLANKYPNIEEEYLNSISCLDPVFKEVVKNLKNKYSLGIISNDVKEWSKFLLSKFSVVNLFDLILISGGAKYRKPDKEIFRIFLRTAKIAPEECIFVDDKLSNLQAASELGMDAIRFIREEGKAPHCFEFEVSSFVELFHVIISYF